MNKLFNVNLKLDNNSKDNYFKLMCYRKCNGDELICSLLNDAVDEYKVSKDNRHKRITLTLTNYKYELAKRVLNNPDDKLLGKILSKFVSDYIENYYQKKFEINNKTNSDNSIKIFNNSNTFVRTNHE